jgi:effector-binding domain-containing protein
MAEVSVQNVSSKMLAAVRRQVRIGAVGSAWKPALDKVWAFLGKNPGLRQDGHNVFLYHHPADRQSPMDVDFGVEVIRPFERAGEVFLAETPAGRVASAVHVGSYSGLRQAHDAIHAWAAASSIKFAGKSWEIYGDWNADETKLETRVEYLLADC